MSIKINQTAGEGAKPQTVSAYIASFPTATQKIMEQLRTTILQAAPDAEETISYQMPAYIYLGMLVYFAAYKNHIGFYPTPSAITVFKDKLASFKGAKGSVQFPLDQPLPHELIAEIVQFRVQENLARAATQKKKNQ